MAEPISIHVFICGFLVLCCFLLHIGQFALALLQQPIESPQHKEELIRASTLEQDLEIGGGGSNINELELDGGDAAREYSIVSI